jgi:hypothetical protein
MSVRKIVFILTAVCLMTSIQAYGQGSKQLKKAYEEFSAGHYSSAADLLRKA